MTGDEPAGSEAVDGGTGGRDDGGTGGRADGRAVGEAESETDTGYRRATDLATLESSGRELVNLDGQAIALFVEDGTVRAVDNRCPHMGFPLTEGTVDDGILTCHWHHARFELSCGDTFDPWADDVPTYPVDVRDGEVWVRPTPRRDAPPAEHWRERLDVGLEENLRLVLAKAAIGLDRAGVDPAVPFAQGLAFGTAYRAEGWGSGLTIHVALSRLADGDGPVSLDAGARRRATYVGLSRVAGDCAGSPPRFTQPALSATDVGRDRLKAWFREAVEVRDTDGAERTLRAAVRDLERGAVAELVLAAATDHRYLDAGHSLDFCNKAFEALDGMERAGRKATDGAGGEPGPADVLATTVDGLTGADRAEEQAAWRRPIDVAALVADAADTIRQRVEAGDGTAAPDGDRRAADWSEPPDFQETVLADDPAAAIDAVVDAARSGASPAALANALVDAAARRIAQFATTNEFSDWNTVHHTYTYANAVHGLTRRTDCWEGYRGTLDVAAKLYLDRFLNVPPAPVPDGDPSATTDDAVERIRDAVEREGGVDDAGAAAADYLAAGGSPGDLLAVLGDALVREDAGFHPIQNVEVAATQVGRTTTPERRRLHCVAAARYLAAHTPTRREAEQTFTIAERLASGERIHEADPDAAVATD